MGFFLLETLKTTLKMRNLTEDGQNQGIFFQIFQFLKKGRGDLPLLPLLVTRLSDHYARNIYMKVSLRKAVPWILLTSKVLYWKISKFFRKYRSSHPEVFCKKGFLRSFTKIAGKYLCQSLYFLITLQPWGLQLYSERDSGTGVFLWILLNF